MGRLISCGCDQHGNENIAIATKDSQWKWGGCSHNVEYGMEFSKQFLDTREKAGDIQSTVNLHNNQAGRLVSATLSFLVVKPLPPPPILPPTPRMDERVH